MATQQYTITYGRDRANAIFTDAMTRMYGLVALGVVTTAATIWIGDMVGVGRFVLGMGWIGMLASIALIFGTLFAANGAIRRGNIALATGLYLAFTAIWGLFLSPILIAYTTSMIGLAFVFTGGLFVAMSIVGWTTKRDLTKLGPMLLFGLIGMIVVGLVNSLLIGSSGLFLVINIVLLPIFMALTVWETKQMKQLAQQAAMSGDSGAASQVAVMGSIGLYLNVINMFMIVLSLLGFASND